MGTTISRLALGASLSALGIPVALAQADSTQPSATEGQLQEVIVTARKTGESIVDVPVSVTAITADQLEQRGIIDIRGIDAYTPGFTDVGGPSFGRLQRGAPYYVIRGMIPGRTIDTLRQTVSMFVDGVPVSGGNIAGLSDIERVEVVKGPQSAYFGRSSFGGAINLITREPGFEWRGRLSTDFSSFSTNETTASIEGPIVMDRAAFRLGARYYDTGGPYRNSQGGRLGEQETRSVTAQLLLTPSDQLRISLFGTAWRDDDGAPISGVLGAAWSVKNAYNCDMGLGGGQNNGICGEVPGLDYVSLWHDVAALSDPAIRDVLVNGEGLRSILGPGFIDHVGLERKAHEAHANIQYDLANGYVFNANVGFNKNELATINDGIQVQLADPTFKFLDRGDLRNEDSSVELRLSSPRDRAFKWLVGVNYLDLSSETATLCWFFGPFDCEPPRKNTADTYGVFGSVSYDFGNGYTITGEARRQWDEIASDVPGVASAEETFTSFTPRVILTKRLSDRTNAYVSFARGNKPGTFNLNLLTLTPEQQSQVIAQTNASLAVPEEKIDMYEVGLKGDFLDNRLRILSSVYYGRWKDQQVTRTGLYTLDTPSGPQHYSINLTVPVGFTRLQGIELESQYQITDNLLAEAVYNLADTNIRKYSCGNCAAYETGSDDVTGNELPLFPKHKATFALTYARNFSAGYSGFIRGELLYRSKIYATESNLTWIGDSRRVNLRVGFETDRLSFELYGRNILEDENYQSIAWAGTFLGTLATNDINEWVVGPPERPTVGLRVEARFGGQ